MRGTERHAENQKYLNFCKHCAALLGPEAEISPERDELCGQLCEENEK
jgi:hypothetical protein